MDIVEKLYSQIEKELETCSADETPVICENLDDEENKRCIIQTIAEFVLTQKINISQAIVQVERSFGLNDEA
jgi:translation initiation factor 2 gamma subunit (eIF-2gamma)